MKAVKVQEEAGAVYPECWFWFPRAVPSPAADRAGEGQCVRGPASHVGNRGAPPPIARHPPILNVADDVFEPDAKYEAVLADSCSHCTLYLSPPIVHPA